VDWPHRRRAQSDAPSGSWKKRGRAARAARSGPPPTVSARTRAQVVGPTLETAGAGLGTGRAAMWASLVRVSHVAPSIESGEPMHSSPDGHQWHVAVRHTSADVGDDWR